jgi:hypothetical protein
MRPINEAEIRACFVNSTKGEAARMNLPKDFAAAPPPWEDLDFLGWRDPGAPERAYLVAERGGRLIGIALRAGTGGGRGFTSTSICTLCKTARTGGDVTLMGARRAGEAGRNGNSVGQYICGDLACSLYIRGKKISVGAVADETLDLSSRIARLEAGVDAFIGRVMRGAS